MQGEKFLPHRELVLQQAGGIFRQHFEARPQAEDGAARGNEKAREGNPFLHAAARKAVCAENCPEFVLRIFGICALALLLKGMRRGSNFMVQELCAGCCKKSRGGRICSYL